MMRWITAALAALVYAALSIAPAAAADKVVPMLNWYVYGEHAPFYYGKAKGIYAAEGIDLEIQEGRGSAATTQAVAAKTADFGYVDVPTMMRAAIKGAPVISTGVLLQTSPMSVMGFVDKNIRKPEDIKGKTVAITPADSMTQIWPLFLKKTRLKESDFTLDANAQYADLAALGVLVDRLERDRALIPITKRLHYVEQPMPRDVTKTSPLGVLAKRDFIIDEADDSYDAFLMARALGYRGISSKSCKGIYKSIVNATRIAKLNVVGGEYIITGEDLTCQAGLAVQQDLALDALIGIAHAERNGHHYVDGFADTPAAEAEAFMAAHPDPYRSDGGKVRLAIHDGDLLTGSLTTPDFATSVHPVWSTLAPLAPPPTRILREQSI